MCSRCRSATIRLAALLLATLGAGGCHATEPSTAAEGAAPVRDVPVGPLPGPGRFTPITNRYADDAAALAEGRRLFVRFNCSGCHGGHAGGGMGPSLRDRTWIYGGSAGHIYDSIAEGRAHGMPAWGTTLPADYVWKLTAYVQSLGTPAEPQAPQ